MKNIWVTNETPARVLLVKGRSALTPDCLVAEVEGSSQKGIWIVDDGVKTSDCCVCGLGDDVRARRVEFSPPEKKAPATLPQGRHDAYKPALIGR